MLAALALPQLAAAQTTLYQRTDASTVSGYNVASPAAGTAVTSANVTTTNRGSWIPFTPVWISPPVGAVTFQTTDTFTCNGWGLEGDLAANTSLGCELHRYTAGSEEGTPFCTAASATELGTTVSVRSATCNPTSATAFTAGDRIVVYWGAVNAGTMARNYTVTLNYGGTAGGANGDTYVTSSRTIPWLVEIGNGSAEPASQSLDAGATRALDAFSLQATFGTATITQVVVNLTNGTALSGIAIQTSSTCSGGTTYGTLSSPVTGANTVTTTGLTATTTSGSTSLYVCATGGSVGTPTPVNGDVASVTATGYGSSDGDTTSATLTVQPPAITIGNGTEPGNSTITQTQVGGIDGFTVQTATGTATITAVGVNLTAGNAALANLFVNGAAACNGTTYGTLASPAAGNNTIPLTTNISATTSSGTTTYYVCGTGAPVATNTAVTGNVYTVTASGYAATDADTTNSTLTVQATVPSVTTVGDGTNPGDATIAPGAGATAVDAFTLQTSEGTETVTGATVTLSAGAAAGLSAVSIWSGAGCTGTQHFSASSPASDVVTLAAGTNITATTTLTPYYVCVTPRSHAAMPAPPGSTYPVAGTVTALTSGNAKDYADGTSSTVTIDNLSTGNATWGTVTAGNAQVSLSWTNPADADFAEVVILRSTASIADVPTEGATYVEGGTIGASVVRYVGNLQTFTDAVGLVNGSDYWYRIFAKDTHGNYSASGTDTGPHRPQTSTTALSSGTDPTPAAPICPGGAATYVDQLVFTSTPTADTVVSLTAGLGAGAGAAVATVELRDVVGSPLDPPRATVPTGDTATFGAANVSSALSPGSTYRLYVTPLSHALAPAGTFTLQARVTSFDAQTYPESGSDTANAFSIDSAAPAEAVWGTVTPGDNQVSLSWANPAADGGAAFQQVVVLRRKTTTAFAETLADGSTPPAEGTTTAGGSAVVYSRAWAAGLQTFVDSTVANGNTYIYRVYVLDACGNWNAGAPAGPYLPVGAFVAEGSTVVGAPTISIVNPAKGSVVSGTFRVQIRVFNAAAQGGIAGLVGGSLAYRTSDGAAWVTTGITEMTAYDTLTDGVLTGRTYQVQLTPGAGDYLLRAKVSNSVATDVLSAGVGVTAVAARTGDGRLLVRDNSSQLCSDCHAIATHGSEGAGSKYGSWSTTCRDCHAPHGTTNVGLIASQITPPAITAPQTPKGVVFHDKTGMADASYASTAANGPCQVCHTRTTYYRASGMDVDPETGQPTVASGGHNPTGSCVTCHSHTRGMAASCTGCHGTDGRASIPGADSQQQAAPPAVATKDGQTVVAVANGGAHLAHVNQSTLRGAPLACAQCHPWPNVHQETTQTDVLWSTLATSGGVTPTPAAGAVTTVWTAAPSCTNWCHGEGLEGGGGTNRSTPPAWTGTSAPCGSCHASPPPVDATVAADHPQNVACAGCHGGDYAQASIGATSKATHIDGTVQKPANGCTACHGKLAGPAPAVALGSTAPEAAPGYDDLAVDTRGDTYSTSPLPVSVGAHGKHVGVGVAMMSAKACGVCHPHPTDGDTSHADGGATEMAWTAPANAGGVTPSYASPSCTNYCHSSGDPMGAGTPTTTAVTWTSQTAMTCTSCHPTGALATNAHDRHVTRFACSECHVATTPNGTSIVIGGGAHVNGANDVAFDGASAWVAGGSYAAGQCSNVYCHSDGTDRSAPYTSGPSTLWADTATCTSCHGGAQTSAAPIASGRHPNHVNVAGTIGGAESTNLECGTCHAATVAVGTDGPVMSATDHVDRTATVSFDPLYGGSFLQGVTEGTGSCSSTYCHSSGQATAVIQHRTVAWNDPALDCNGCHGTGTTTGAPDYGSGGAGTPTANSHAAHVTAAADCEHCHAGTAAASGTAILATSALHLDKSRDVVILGAYDTNGATSNYDTGTKTCSGVSCHGSGTPQWGGPSQKCSDCHAGPSDVNSFAFGTAGVIGTSEWTAVGHGQAATGFPTIADGAPCLYCHDGAVTHDQATNPFRLRGASDAAGATVAYETTTALTTIAACLNCHAVSGANGVDPDGVGGQPKVGPATKRIGAYHYGSGHAELRDGGLRCWDCHDVHGDGSNLAMIGTDTLREGTDVHGFAGTRSTTGAVLTTQGAGGYANTTSRNGICQVCHTTTKYWRSASEPTAHNAGTDCISCHDHDQPPNNAFKGAGACSACHMGAASASTSTDLDEFPPVYGGAEAKSLLDPEDWLATGHGRTTVVGAYPQSTRPAANFPAPSADADPCYYCHAPDQAIYVGGPTSLHDDIGGGAGTNPFRLANTGTPVGTNKNGVCLVCHAPGSLGFDPDNSEADARYPRINRTSSTAIDATHYMTAGGHHDATHDGGALCWDCHDPHGDWNYANARPIAYMIQARPTLDGDAYGWGSPSGCPGACQVSGTVVDFAKDGGTVANVFDGADYVTAANAGVCQVCHESTATDPTVNAVLYWKSDGSGSGHQNGQARCVACHDHQQSSSTSAFAQATACSDCHASVPATGKHSLHVGAATPAYGDAGNHASASAYGYGCGKCHDDAASPPASPALHYDDLGGTTSDPYQVQVNFDWTSGSPEYATGTQSRDTNATSGLVFWTSTGTCLTYCHSSGQATPTYKSPGTWDAATPAMPTDCTGCHGGNAAVTTPANRLATSSHAFHVNNAAYIGANVGCARCHAATVSADRTLHATTGRPNHVDGERDVSATSWNGTTCAANECHSNGTETPDYKSVAWGGTDTADACNECHGSDSPAGFTPTVYGEPNYAERVVNQGDDKRNSHSKHVSRTDANVAKTQCVTCHSASIDASGNLLAAGSHLDGAVQITVGGAIGSYDPTGEACGTITCHAGKSAEWGGTLNCWSCHGTSRTKDPSVLGTVDANLSAAPPVDASGNPAPAIGVGAHLKHVNSGTYRTNALACTDCHPTAGTTHNGTGDAAWSTLATGNGAVTPTPAAAANAYSTSWEATPTCTNWCHGAALNGGTYQTTPARWTATGTTCGSCHGSPPPLSATAGEDHPKNAVCQDCHGTGYLTTGLTGTSKNTHIDATIQKPASGCTACHGVLAGVAGASVTNTSPTAAPGYVGTTTGESIRGETLASAPAIGAHDKHLRGTTLRTTAAACSDCHAVPANLDVTHATGTGTGGAHATVTWSAFVDTASLTPVYSGSNSATTNTAAGTCASTYCHGKWTGNATYAGTNVAPSWTGGAAAAACGTCHKIAPTSSGHGSVTSTTSCSNCHPGYNCTSGNVAACTVDTTKHINGQLDGGGGPNCTTSGCHDAATGTVRNVFADFQDGTSLAHHVGSANNAVGLAGTLTDNDCRVCHAEYDAAQATTGTLHMNGFIDLRDADNTTVYYQYDSNGVAALLPAGANSGSALFRQEMSGRTDDLTGSTPTTPGAPNYFTASCPSGSSCKKGLDRFCISCHDADGASGLSALFESGGTAANPFADTRISNNYDQQVRCAAPGTAGTACTTGPTGNQRVVDVASRVHENARQANGTPVAATDRDNGYTTTLSGASYVRGADSRYDPPEGVFARHAIRGLSVSTYGAGNTNWDGFTTTVPPPGTDTTYWKRTSYTWYSKSVMACADCHTTDGVNGSAGNAHGSGTEYMLKDASGGATQGTETGQTYVCFACHISDHYSSAGASFGHTGNAQDYQEYLSPTYTGLARVDASSTGGNIYGYPCGSCHGGGPPNKAGAVFPTGSTGATGFGTIHGTSQVLGIQTATGTTRPSYRFTNGNSMRYYNPNDWVTAVNRNRTCYTIGTGDNFGGCTKHSGSGGTQAASTSKARPLNY